MRRSVASDGEDLFEARIRSTAAVSFVPNSVLTVRNNDALKDTGSATQVQLLKGTGRSIRTSCGCLKCLLSRSPWR
jgi:hypothetical protein